MPRDIPKLPSGKQELALMIDRHMDREHARLAPTYTMWRLATMYMMGYRQFRTINMATGTVVPYVTGGKSGGVEFQSTQMLKVINDVVGRVSSMDANPAVNRHDDSLSSIRDRAAGQVIADSLVSEQSLNSAVDDFAWIFTCLGGCGITSEVQDHPALGLTADFEVVHPRELFPFPSLGDDHTKARGMVRQRLVPLDFLAERLGSKAKGKQALKDMEWYWADPGDVLYDPFRYEEDAHATSGSGGSFFEMGDKTERDPDKSRVRIVRVRELWTNGPAGTCGRYVISSGRHLLFDQDLSDREVYCPIGYARFLSNGTFHGAGMFHLLFSLHRELEKMLKDLFENMRAKDKFGMLVLPAGQFNERAALEDVGDKLKVLTWRPDIMEQGFNPFHVEPHTTGDLPGRTATFAQGLMDVLNPIDDIIQDKGRIDSAAAMEILQEEAARKLTSPLRGVETAFGGMYRSMIASAVAQLIESPRQLPVTRLTPELAGVVLSGDGASVQFPANPIPAMSRLRVGVREVSPKNRGNERRAAIEYFTQVQGGQDEQALRLYALKNGFDLPTYMEDDKAAYESVIADIIRLYNDGVNPYEAGSHTEAVLVSPHTAKPALQLRVLAGFMGGPVFKQASVVIQDGFKAYRMQLMMVMGNVMEAAVGNPDDLALAAEALSAQNVQGQGQPGVDPTAVPDPFQSPVAPGGLLGGSPGAIPRPF